jgi:hypothetical protein
LSSEEIKFIRSKSKLPEGWDYLDYDTALANHEKFKNKISRWGIVRAGTGSFDGCGYNYRHRRNEKRGCADTLIYKKGVYKA